MSFRHPPDDGGKGYVYDQKSSILQPRTPRTHPPLPPPVAPHGRRADPHLGLGLGAAVDVPGRAPREVAPAAAATCGSGSYEEWITSFIHACAFTLTDF